MTGTKRRAAIADRATDGRRASRTAAKPNRRGAVERPRVRMPERVTTRWVGSPSAESTRFPGEGQSAQGQSGPKARPKGVADGQGVNIPPPDGKDEPRRTPRHASGRGVRRPRAARPTALRSGSLSGPGHEKPRGDDTSARTAIRHRCARRGSEGVRENPREGTRQNDPVPSVQGVLAGRPVSRRESALATVYQKHRTLPTRKRTYRV